MIYLFYILNKNSQIATGDHKIHTNECSRKPKRSNTIELGEFYDIKVAKCEARKYFFNVDGCKFCCNSIHLKK